MARIGIMQGRLLPPPNGRYQGFPRERWVEEFPRAAEAGLDTIEWIYDVHGGGANPIETDEGTASMHGLARKHGIGVISLCAHYFIERPLLAADSDEQQQQISRLRWLIRRCERARIQRVVLPLLDSASIQNSDPQQAVDVINRLLPLARACNVELHLETDLEPKAFARLLERLDSTSVKVTYDLGNSSSFGYHPQEEFAAYGSRVGSVHIKDRTRSGGTVPLGQGSADFDALFTALRRTGYNGDFIFEVARPTSEDEVNWARMNRSFLLRYLASDSTTRS